MLLLTISALFMLAHAQTVDDDTKKKVDDFFAPTPTPLISGYEEVTSATQGSIGAIQKCGETSDKGVHLCVPYYMCDAKTNTIVQTGVNRGFGKIDIRFGENTCNHYLDVCCKIPKGGLDPNLPLPRNDSSTVAPTPTPPVDIPVTKPTIPSYCGIRNPQGIDFSITGDKDGEAQYGEFPWMLALIKKNEANNVHPAVCGGSLITPNIVLTAAHCVQRQPADNLKIRAGEWDTQTTKERLPYQERNVINIIMHEKFDAGIVTNDVALLVLDRPVDKADNVGTICLPTQGQVIESTKCFVSGWGKNFFGTTGIPQSILKKISLPTVPHGQCENALKQTRLGLDFVLDESFMCAGGKQGKDACTGDGGSPLVCPDPLNRKRYIQAGIVAWGIGCGEENVPGVYADVTKFRTWIDGHMERLNIDTASYNL